MSMKSYTARCSSNLILIFKRASLKTGCVLVDNMCIGARTSSPDVLHLDFTLVRPIVAQNFSRREVFCPHRALASLPVLLRCSFKYILFNYLSDLVSLSDVISYFYLFQSIPSMSFGFVVLVNDLRDSRRMTLMILRIHLNDS